MTPTGPLEALTPALRGRAVSAGLGSENIDRLWRSVVDDAPAEPAGRCLSAGPALPYDILSLLQSEPAPPMSIDPAALGPNRAHSATLEAAAERTGVPAAAIAAIIDAEAARRPDGSWNPRSQNPRSSAAGLGQFLSSTWVGEAERRGTWLHSEAERRGWLDRHGRVDGAARPALLALRMDPEASIEATADLARANLGRLRRAGIEVPGSAAEQARFAWLGHHLGAGDAARFLKTGLSEARAGRLLAAQVGASAAASRIAATGDAAVAHRRWLLAYVDQRIRPGRYIA